MEKLDLEKVYQRRFADDVEFRKKIWRVLCKDFFQKYIPKDAVILDIGAGYCEFINNIFGKRKIALDLNPDVKKYADSDVEAVLSDCRSMSEVKDSSCDTVFVSNFFEHLPKNDIIKVIKEICRVLVKNGRLLVLQSNIRFCYKNYWNFFDHITPLDDKSLSEALEINGFKVIKCLPRFLPYTTKSKLPRSLLLLKIYLKVPILQRVLGGQLFICAKKI